MATLKQLEYWERMKGKPSGMLGKKHSLDGKLKMRIARLKNPIPNKWINTPMPPEMRHKMRIAPTVSFYTYDGTAGSWSAYDNSGATATPTIAQSTANTGDMSFEFTTGAVTDNRVYTIYGHWVATAEL